MIPAQPEVKSEVVHLWFLPFNVFWRKATKIIQSFAAGKKKLSMALLAFKWLTPLLFSLYHPFYIGVTEITHLSKSQEYEVTAKLFVEDLENVLSRQLKTVVHLGDAAKHTQYDRLVSAYVQQHLSVVADGKTVSLRFLGFEVDKESVYCYFDAGPAAAPKQVQVRNSLLHDFIDQQINIVHVTVNGKRQSTKLNYPEKSAGFQF